MSAHTNAGSEQSGLVGHHSRCFLDCKIPLGSRINRTKRIPKLKEIIILRFVTFTISITKEIQLCSYSSCSKSFSAARSLKRTIFID